MKATLILLIAVLGILSSPSSYAQYYDLYCRGPLNLDATGDTIILLNFSKSATSSGTGGSSLKPGECSWADRKMNPSEPSRLQLFENRSECTQDPRGATQVDVTWSALASSQAAQRFSLLAAAVQSKDTVVIFQVRNELSVTLIAKDSQPFGCVGPKTPLFRTLKVAGL